MKTHGIASTYHHGCRCDPCRKANSADMLARNHERATRPAPSHGSWSSYTNWGCRCDECKAAAVIVNARDYQRRKLEAAATSSGTRSKADGVAAPADRGDGAGMAWGSSGEVIPARVSGESRTRTPRPPTSRRSTT